MNLKYTIVIILAFVLTSCQLPKNKTIIKGTIIGNIPDQIEYTLPVNNISYFLFEKTVQPDSLGNFQIELELEKASIIELSKSYIQYGVIVAEPGMNYHILIDTDKENGFIIEGKNKKGQEIYNQLYQSEADMEIEAMEFFKDSVVSDLKQKIKKVSDDEIAAFDELLGEHIISEDFFNLVKTDRTYFYQGVLSMIPFLKRSWNSMNHTDWNKDGFNNMWKEIYQIHPVTNPDFMSSPWFYYYVRSYLQYFEITDEHFDEESLKELYKQGLLNTHKVKNAKEFLNGDVLEYYYAAHIKMTSMGENYEKELITLFNEFKEDYPSSKYIQFLEPAIQPIIKYHELKSKSFGDGVDFIDNLNNTDSFDVIIEELKGKKVYVDIWATWCTPCKVEFGHKKVLNKLLKTNNIEILYISIDKDDRERQWREMIKFYDLKGHHIRANKELNNDLIEIIGGRYGIPRYFLVDENGIIINKMAEPPSKIEKLENQINKM